MYPNEVTAGKPMKRCKPWAVGTLLAAACLWMTVPGPAVASAALAAQKGCLGCHAVDRARVGPAFQQVARRYAGQPGAALRLADKVRHGGRGQWGVAVMPSHPRLSNEELRLLVEWVLAQAPAVR